MARFYASIHFGVEEDEKVEASVKLRVDDRGKRYGVLTISDMSFFGSVEHMLSIKKQLEEEFDKFIKELK